MQNINQNNFYGAEANILLDTKQLKAFLRIKGDATLWRYLKEGKIPQPRLAVSRTKRLWALDEVLNYQKQNDGGEK